MFPNKLGSIVNPHDAGITNIRRSFKDFEDQKADTEAVGV